MKKIATILLAVLLFCSCGGTDRDIAEGWDLPPKKLFDVIEKNFSEEKEESITFFAENGEEYEISYDLRFRFQKQEGESWVLIEPLNKEEITEEFVLNSGEKKKITFVFEDIFGKLPAGNYRVVVTSFRDNGNRNQWYEHYYFEIEEKNPSEKEKIAAEAAGCDNVDIIAKITNGGEKEVFLLEYNEIFIEGENGFEKLDTVRGINFGDTKTKILPGESVDYFYRTGGSHGTRPVGKYRVNLFIEFYENGKTFEQIVPFEFELTGFEETNIVPLWERTVSLSGNILTIGFQNGFNYEIRYGDDYYIQRLEGEDWVTAETKGIPAFDTVLWSAEAGETAEWKTDLSLIYGELPAGSYRLVKTFFTDADNYINGKHYAFFEFEIK